jgi:signal transduction histidine kinase
MTDVSARAASPQDPKGRLIAIFVGAVLLPSLALSVLSLYSVPRSAEAMKIGIFKRAERLLSTVEEELEWMARNRALEAARVVGWKRLLEGRPSVIRAALKAEGMNEPVFDSLRLEGASRVQRGEPRPAREDWDMEILREAIDARAPEGASGEAEDSVDLSKEDSKLAGMLKFTYACAYARGTMLPEFMSKLEDYLNPHDDMVIRVSAPDGAVLYENAPTADKGLFEVKRVMKTPTFRGLRLWWRPKDRTIEEEVKRNAMGKIVLIAFIDLMLGAGLVLVYSNVRREMHLSKLKSDFVANVSHELKTPLALIRLFAETLELGRASSEDKARQYYRVINKESQRLTQLINNILDFSRIEAGRKEYRFAATDVGAIVLEVIDAYRFPIEQQGFELSVRIDDDLPEVEVDKEAIGQALINLVNNAIKYSRDQKFVGLDVRRDADRLLIAVTDRGIGVAKSEERKIFEKFYRAEDSLVHETKGSGLGLPLVQHIMEAHGGSVDIESTPGRGSTFTLILPLQRRGGPVGALDAEPAKARA